jgi:hypothetical protein
MAFSQQLSGARKLLDGIELKARKGLSEARMGENSHVVTEKVRLTNTEIQMVEQLVTELWEQATGSEISSQKLWTTDSDYISQRKSVTPNYYDEGYWHLSIQWIEATRAFLDYIEGYNQGASKELDSA